MMNKQEKKPPRSVNYEAANTPLKNGLMMPIHKMIVHFPVAFKPFRILAFWRHP